MSKKEENLENLWKKLYNIFPPDTEDILFKKHQRKLTKHLCMANYHIKCLNDRGLNHSIDLINHNKDS